MGPKFLKQTLTEQKRTIFRQKICTVTKIIRFHWQMQQHIAIVSLDGDLYTHFFIRNLDTVGGWNSKKSDFKQQKQWSIYCVMK